MSVAYAQESQKFRLQQAKERAQEVRAIDARIAHLEKRVVADFSTMHMKEAVDLKRDHEELSKRRRHLLRLIQRAGFWNLEELT